MKKYLILFGCLTIVVIGGGVFWLYGAPATPPIAVIPTIGATTVTPTVIAVNTPATVTVTSVITSASVISTSVNLLRINATGSPTILGQLHDDGKNGDAVKGDKIFTAQVTFNETKAGQAQLQISAAFRGVLKRTLSNLLIIDIWKWNSFNSSVIKFGFKAPSSNNIIGEMNISTSTAGDPMIAFELWSSNQQKFVPVVRMRIYSNPNNVPLQNWFEQNIDEAGILMINGTFQQIQLVNGLFALVRVSSLPHQYQGDPVAEAYLMSPTGDRVVGITHSQDYQLTDFGFSKQSSKALLLQILGSVQFF